MKEFVRKVYWQYFTISCVHLVHCFLFTERVRNDKLESKLAAIAEVREEDKRKLAQRIQEMVRKESSSVQEACKGARKADENHRYQLQFKHLFTLLPAKG